jgi:hypothetical protein
MILSHSIRQGDMGRCDQNGLGCAEKWMSVSPCPPSAAGMAVNPLDSRSSSTTRPFAPTVIPSHVVAAHVDFESRT